MALLRDLRGVDPLAELYYAGEGEWWLGVVKFHSPRRKKGSYLCRVATRRDITNWTMLRIGKLMQQGFGLIARYRIQGEPDSRIVRDFQMRDWIWRMQAELHFNQRLDEAEGGPARRAAAQRAQDYLMSESHYAYSRFVRGNPRVGYGD